MRTVEMKCKMGSPKLKLIKRIVGILAVVICNFAVAQNTLEKCSTTQTDDSMCIVFPVVKCESKKNPFVLELIFDTKNLKPNPEISKFSAYALFVNAGHTGPMKFFIAEEGTMQVKESEKIIDIKFSNYRVEVDFKGPSMVVKSIGQDGEIQVYENCLPR